VKTCQILFRIDCVKNFKKPFISVLRMVAKSVLSVLRIGSPFSFCFTVP